MPPSNPRQVARFLGCDGVERTAAAEKQLNITIHAAFNTGAGREALAYLRSITIEFVCGPNVTDAELRHREGMRSLVGIIETRMRQGGKP